MVFGRVCNPNLLTKVNNAHASRDSLAAVAQLVERIHGKDEVSGSIPDRGSITRRSRAVRSCLVLLQKKPHF